MRRAIAAVLLAGIVLLAAGSKAEATTAPPRDTRATVTLAGWHFDRGRTTLLTPSGKVSQELAADHSTTPGSLVLELGLGRPKAALLFGASVERLAAGRWTEVPLGDLAFASEPGANDKTARMLIAARSGWEPGVLCRVRYSVGLADQPEVSLDDTLTWRVDAAGAKADAQPPPVIFDRSFPVEFDSAQASADTLGGRFPGGQNMLFQGMWTDPVTGLGYARNRWYDPRNGVFLSEDPAGSVDSPNIYAFVGHQPNMATDPMGLCMENCPLQEEAQAVLDQAAAQQRRQHEAERRARAEEQARNRVHAEAEMRRRIVDLEYQLDSPVGRLMLLPAVMSPFMLEAGELTTISEEDAAVDVSEAEVVRLAGPAEFVSDVPEGASGQVVPGDASPEPVLSRSAYGRLRKNTPNRTMRNAVNPEGPKVDPVYGYDVERFEADHIVPMKEVTQMPGFARLTFKRQVEVLNLPENFRLSKTSGGLIKG